MLPAIVSVKSFIKAPWKASPYPEIAIDNIPNAIST
jgi:hypothetical protein